MFSNVFLFRRNEERNYFISIKKIANFVNMDNKKFIDSISARLGKSKEEVGKLIESLAKVVSDSVKEGDTVAIPSVGSFEAKMRMEREAMHPSSGKRILVPPKLSVVFKPSALFKQKLR